jgi:alpha-tubulin suppressor-like RCC1 family protein
MLILDGAASMQRILPVVATSLLIGAVACGEPTPTRPSQQVASVVTGPVSQAALEAQINSLINALFAPKDQGAIYKQFAQIKSQLASGKTSDAQASIVAFVQLLLTAQQGGVLQDPNGDQPPSIADALRDLVNSVAQLGGLPPPLPGTNPFAGDGAVAVVGPAGGTVVTSSGFGGVGFPPGALPADVIVVVERLPNPVTPGAGPLPTALTQYPLFYDFSTVPAVAQFAVPVTVGICQLEVGEPFAPPTQAIADRLQLAHPDPANPTTIEILPRTTAGFVNCNGVTLASIGSEAEPHSLAGRALALLTAGGSRVLELFRPTVAYAVHGGLGGKTTSFSPFAAVNPGLTFSLVSSGLHTCGVTTSGAAYCWGRNDFGGLGDGSTTDSPVPVPVSGGLTFSSVSTWYFHTCGVTTGGAAYCWGLNNGGQLGNGPTTNSAVPVPVSGGLSFARVSTGQFHTCGVTPLGAAYCWGAGGALGNGPSGNSSVPVPVSGGLTFLGVSSGSGYTCGVTTGGAAYCWGGNTFGALGNGSTTPALVPVPVAGGLSFSLVRSGGFHTCGVTTSGATYCWGGNFAGQLGTGSTSDSSVPLLVLGGLTFTGVTAGGSHTCGATAVGAGYCWGDNSLGQLGDGSFTSASVPTPVAGGLSFTTGSAGHGHTCGVTTSGAAYCWGANGSGQLGDGSTTSSNVPVRVQ